MHHPEKAFLGTTAGTGNTATRILMKPKVIGYRFRVQGSKVIK
jgi:hypothetical protein